MVTEYLIYNSLLRIDLGVWLYSHVVYQALQFLFRGELCSIYMVGLRLCIGREVPSLHSRTRCYANMRTCYRAGLECRSGSV